MTCSELSNPGDGGSGSHLCVPLVSIDIWCNASVHRGRPCATHANTYALTHTLVPSCHLSSNTHHHAPPQQTCLPQALGWRLKGKQRQTGKGP